MLDLTEKLTLKKEDYRISMGDNSTWLVWAILIRTNFEHYNITLERIRNFYKLRKYKGEVIDFHKILTEQPMSRWHRRMIASGKTAKLKLKNDRIFMNAAQHWYQCRVVFSSVNKYCEAQSYKGIRLDPKNIEKEIKPCDQAVGYQGRIRNKSN